MVLLGASARAEPAEQREAFAASTTEVARNGFGPELVEFVLSVLFAKTTLADPAKAAMLDDVRRHLGGIGPAFVHAATGVVERESAISLLPDIKAATLVVSGTEDLVRPPAWSDELFDGIPDCQLWRLKGVGHSPALEAPELINPKIIDFLGLDAGAN
jgi:3-oxoadipate enol-lactonase